MAYFNTTQLLVPRNVCQFVRNGIVKLGFINAKIRIPSLLIIRFTSSKWLRRPFIFREAIDIPFVLFTWGHADRCLGNFFGYFEKVCIFPERLIFK